MKNSFTDQLALGIRNLKSELSSQVEIVVCKFKDTEFRLPLMFLAIGTQAMLSDNKVKDIILGIMNIFYT